MPQFTSRQRNQAEKLLGDVITSLNPGKDEFQQRVLGDLWVRTATCHSDGNRLNLNWNEGRLNCDNWNWDENSNSNLAVAALMV